MRITIDVEHSHAPFLLELLTSLDYVAIDSEVSELSPQLKKLIDDRLDAYEKDPNNLIDWNDIPKSYENKATA
jgi:Putative addiction module component